MTDSHKIDEVGHRPVALAIPKMSGQQHTLVLVLAGFAAFGVGLRVHLPASLTPAILVGVALLPVWVSTLGKYAWARSVMSLAVLAIANGLLLSVFAAQTEHIDVRELLATVFLVVSIFMSAGVLLWTRTIIGVVPSIALFSAATALTITRSNAQVLINPWKFGYGLPVSILVLALAWSTRKLWVELAALMVLAIMGMLNDSRSYFALLLIAAVVIVWQRISDRLSKRSLAVSTLGLVAGAGLVYFLAARLSASGVLGEAAAARTQMQIDQSGSLLLGGRPEAAATVALLSERPWGYGLGRMPSWHDVIVAKTGMSRLGYEPNNGYVERYMFGSGFEVHSLIGNFWIYMGIPGVLLILAMCAVVSLSLIFKIRDNHASGLEVLLVTNFLWNVAFSPLFFSVPATAATLATLLWLRQDRDRSSVRGVSANNVNSTSERHPDFGGVHR